MELGGTVVIEGLPVGGRLLRRRSRPVSRSRLGGLRMPFIAYGQVILPGAYGIWTAHAAFGRQ